MCNSSFHIFERLAAAAVVLALKAEFRPLEETCVFWGKKPLTISTVHTGAGFCVRDEVTIFGGIQEITEWPLIMYSI